MFYTVSHALSTRACVRLHRRSLPETAILVLSSAALAVPAAGQKVSTNQTRAVVPSLGQVTAVSPLSVGDRTKTGNLYVSGTVTTMHNGPQSVQVKLAQPINDSVYTQIANGSYVLLNTSTWVTFAAGPGSSKLVSPVNYFVVWAKTSSKDPKSAVSIPVTYRVIP